MFLNVCGSFNIWWIRFRQHNIWMTVLCPANISVSVTVVLERLIKDSHVMNYRVNLLLMFIRYKHHTYMYVCGYTCEDSLTSPHAAFTLLYACQLQSLRVCWSSALIMSSYTRFIFLSHISLPLAKENATTTSSWSSSPLICSITPSQRRESVWCFCWKWLSVAVRLVVNWCCIHYDHKRQTVSGQLLWT